MAVVVVADVVVVVGMVMMILAAEAPVATRVVMTPVTTISPGDVVAVVTGEEAATKMTLATSVTMATVVTGATMPATDMITVTREHDQTSQAGTATGPAHRTESSRQPVTEATKGAVLIPVTVTTRAELVPVTVTTKEAVLIPVTVTTEAVLVPVTVTTKTVLVLQTENSRHPNLLLPKFLSGYQRK